MQHSSPPKPKRERFPALSVPHFRSYALTGGLAMTADNIEHVIGYWVIWQLTHSPFWLGYAVFVHWLPFTLFSFYSGVLVDRFGSRRLIQFAQVTYMGVSFAWGVLYLTGQLQIWHMAVLLGVHGVAGLLYAPGRMLIIHEMVGQERLVSAISINAAMRPMSATAGPAVGGFFLWALGPGLGFLANILLYIPFSIFLLVLPYGASSRERGKERGWAFIFEGVTAVRRSPAIGAVICVAGAAAMLMGHSFQAVIPAFAERLGTSSTGYSILLSGHGVGAILGGFCLGWMGVEKLRPITVTAGALAWATLLAGFAVSHSFVLSFVLLCAAGTTHIVFTSMAQSIVQSWALPALRGRVIGVYNFATLGTRVFSGLSLGFLGSLVGLPVAMFSLSGLVGVAVLCASLLSRSLWAWEFETEEPIASEGLHVSAVESGEGVSPTSAAVR